MSVPGASFLLDVIKMFIVSLVMSQEHDATRLCLLVLEVKLLNTATNSTLYDFMYWVELSNLQ